MNLFTTNNDKKYSICDKLIQGIFSSQHKFKQSKSLADKVKVDQTHFDKRELLKDDEDDCTASVLSDSKISIAHILDQSISHRMQESKNASSKMDFFGTFQIQRSSSNTTCLKTTLVNTKTTTILDLLCPQELSRKIMSYLATFQNKCGYQQNFIHTCSSCTC